MSERQFGQSLLDVKNIHGEVMKSEYGTVAAIHEKLEKKLPGFMGIVLFGSSIKGTSRGQYEWNRDSGNMSDLDFKIIIDTDEFNKTANTHDFKVVGKWIDDVLDEVRAGDHISEDSDGKKIEPSLKPIQAFVVTYSRVDAERYIKDEVSNKELAGVYAMFFGFGTGAKLEKERDDLIEKIKSQPEDERNKIIQNIKDYWINSDVKNGSGKTKNRLLDARGVEEKDVAKFEEDRTRMWNERIDNFFNE